MRPRHRSLGVRRWYRTAMIAVVGAWSFLPMLQQGAAAASPASRFAGGWHIEASPSPGTFDELYGVAAIDPHDIWSVGRFIHGGTSRALIEHSDGTNVNVAFTYGDPAMNSYLFAISSMSAKNVWAVGLTDSLNYEHPHTLIAHWNGSDWRDRNRCASTRGTERDKCPVSGRRLGRGRCWGPDSHRALRRNLLERRTEHRNWLLR